MQARCISDALESFDKPEISFNYSKRQATYIQYICSSYALSQLRCIGDIDSEAVLTAAFRARII